jgi:hypothetical protein
MLSTHVLVGGLYTKKDSSGNAQESTKKANATMPVNLFLY